MVRLGEYPQFWNNSNEIEVSQRPLNGPVVPTELSISPPPCAVASMPDATGPLSDENTTSARRKHVSLRLRKKMQHDA